MMRGLVPVHAGATDAGDRQVPDEYLSRATVTRERSLATVATLHDYRYGASRRGLRPKVDDLPNQAV